MESWEDIPLIVWQIKTSDMKWSEKHEQKTTLKLEK